MKEIHCGLRHAILAALLACLPAQSLYGGDRITVLHAGGQAGHYLTWQGQPKLLIGDSVTQGWME